jgi:hypothetical protein
MSDFLVLDPWIRNWVVLPMVFMLILVGVGRHYVQQIIQSDDQSDIDVVKNKNTAMRAQMLRLHRGSVSEEAFAARRTFMCQKKTGLLRRKVPGPANPMSDMSGMMNMMKGNMTFMLPNMVMMAFVSYFFAGFILVKVTDNSRARPQHMAGPANCSWSQIPFPLPSNGFKLMLQVCLLFF